MKKSLIFWFAAVTCAALFLVGCEQGTGGDGAAGAAGKTIVPVSGTVADDLFQAAIDASDGIIAGDVTITGTSPIVLPSNKTLQVVGTITLPDDGVFVVVGADSLSGPGGFAGTASGNPSYLIAPPAVTAARNGGTDLTSVSLQAFGTDFDNASSVLGVQGDLAITDAAGAAKIASKTVYVTGNVTISNAASPTAIIALGNVSASAAITGAVAAKGKVTFSTAAQNALTGLTAGSVESAVAITTTGNGPISVTGELKTTDAAATVTVEGSGTLTAGSLDLAGNLAAGSGGVTVKGASVLGGNVTRGNGAVTFGGDVTLASGKTITLTGTAKLTLEGNAAIKVGANTVLSASGGKVEITPADGAVLTATAADGGAPAQIAVGTAAITGVAGKLVVSGDLKADGKDITFTAGTGTLAIAPGGKITTTGVAGSGAIVLGASANNGVVLHTAGSWTAGGSGVTLTNSAAKVSAIGKLGTAAATLTASGTPVIAVVAGSDAANVLTLGAGVTIDVAGTATKVGAVVLTGAGSNVGTLKLVDGTSKVITGNTGGAAYTTGVKQSVAAAVTTINTTVIVTVNTNKIVSVAGGGAGNGTIGGGSSGTISIDSETSTTDADS